jgi:3-hydroxyacyl-CoA dehydrogenase
LTTSAAAVDPKLVATSRDGDIAIITIDDPPANALSQVLRAALSAVIEQAVDDHGARAIVLACAGGSFCTGPDMHEYDRSPRPPHLVDIVQRIEDAPKPVIAALHGDVLGGGCELALACHYRIAAPGTRAGFPEVAIGLLPGAGGTQRLPRLVGFETTLEMMLDGKPRRVEAPELAGFVDEIAGNDLLSAALAFARNIVGADAAPRRTRSLPLPAPAPEVFERFAEAVRRRRGETAPVRILAAVKRATEMGFAQAVATARADFLTLRDSAESRALRHAFSAEREVKRLPPGVTAGVAREISRVAVVGGGTMGRGIAIALLDAGLAATLIETDDGALGRAVDGIGAHYRAAVEKQRIDAAERDSLLARLAGATSLAPIPGADCVIEAVFEDIAVKRKLFQEIDRIAKPGTLLASNTSYLDVAEIAAFTRRPQDVIGLHFFSPAHVMRLVEVVRTRSTSPDALASALTLVERLGKTGVVCIGKDGFIGNRMLAPRTRECLFMLEEGALPQDIDAALEGFGFALGPLAVSDLAGLDIGSRNAILRRQLTEVGDRRCDLLDQLVAAGRLGQKTGAGWYRYEPGSRKPRPDPAVEALLVEHSRRRNIVRRTIAPAEIVERCLLAMINEAARIIEEAVTARPSDVDVVWLAGYGFPRHRGGPLWYADQLGAAHLLSRIVALGERLGTTYWTPAPLLRRLAAEAGRFHSPAAN